MLTTSPLENSPDSAAQFCQYQSTVLACVAQIALLRTVTHLMAQVSGMKLNLRARVSRVWFTPSISITAAAPLWKREEGTLWKFCERIAYTPYLSHSVQSQVYESQLPVGLQCLADSNCAGDINVLSPRAHKRHNYKWYTMCGRHPISMISFFLSHKIFNAI